MRCRLEEVNSGIDIRKVNGGWIIFNNLLVVTLSLTGLFTAGASSILILLTNGFVAGLALKESGALNNFSWEIGCGLFYVVFEILALLLSSAIGLLGLPQMFRLFAESKFYFSSEDVIFISIIYSISVLLIIIAGSVEMLVISLAFSF
jgi:uncharacterized membrane protein SpoIIM required for sporulation